MGRAASFKGAGMKNEKQIKVGSMVKMRASREPQRVWRVSGLYGIVCEIRSASEREPGCDPRPLHNIHLSDGDKYWAWESELEVLI